MSAGSGLPDASAGRIVLLSGKWCLDRENEDSAFFIAALGMMSVA